jgi:hypothetical protein
MRVLVSVALIGALGCRAVFGPAAAVGRATAATTATRAETQAVVDWNLSALATAAVPNGVREGHNLALVQAAVFDAVNSIRRRYAPYRDRVRAAGHESLIAAVASAAHAMLLARYPEQQAGLDAALERSLA